MHLHDATQLSAAHAHRAPGASLLHLNDLHGPFPENGGVRCGRWSSEMVSVHTGQLKPSPLSPILFNIYTIKITDKMLDGRRMTLSYKDEILMYRQGRYRT